MPERPSTPNTGKPETEVPARGCAYGLLIVVVFWIVVGFVILRPL